MATRDFSTGTAAREKLVQALKDIATAVASTMGPGGRPFGYDKAGIDGSLTSTYSKDGLTVLRSLDFAEPVYQAVLQYSKQAASHSVLASGDGPQPLWSKVLTPTGFVPMGEMKVGMSVCGTDGTIQEVVGVFPKGEKEIYEIEFANAGIVECCGDHLWTVINTSTLHNEQQMLTTAELSADYHKQKRTGQKVYKYYTPRTQVEFFANSAEMPLDPYTVGVLLGDGSLSGTGSIELSLGKKKEHIIDKLQFPEGFYLNSVLYENKNAYRVKINGKCKHTGRSLSKILNSIGLLGTKSATKFIPKSYLYASIADRKAILQGLIDTDGHINTRGLFEFSSVSEEMANDFKDLCRSLGLFVSLSKLDREEGSSYSMASIFRVTQLKGYKYGDKIIRITPMNKTTQMQCIKVSNPNSLYITDNYIATHNTTSTIVLAAAVAEAVLSTTAQFPQAFARELERDAFEAIELIKKEAIKTEEAAKIVALTSTNGDEELANVVIEAIKMSSAYGTLLVDKNAASKKRYNITRQDGYSNCHGYLYDMTFAQSAFPETSAFKPIVWNNPLIALVNSQFYTKDQLSTILSAWNTSILKGDKRNLVIFVHEVGNEVTNALLSLNRKMADQGVACFVVKPRLTAEVNSSLQIMRDYASYCGISEEHVIDVGNIANVTLDFFGSCKTITIGLNTTAILGRAENHWVEERVRQNLSVIEQSRSEFDKQFSSLRNAELAEGLVKVEVGGGHLGDLQERADRFDDASKSVQSCLRDGALPGGGCSYIRAGMLAAVHPALSSALRSVHNNVLLNYGVVPQEDFYPLRGMSINLDQDRCHTGDAVELGVLDACETVCSVIRNGVTLGLMVSVMGGYSYRQQRVAEEG